MLMICKGDDDKLYCHDGVPRKDMWRNDTVVETIDNDGVIHSAHFRNAYEAEVFLRYAEWSETGGGHHTTIFGLFLSEIWAPEDAERVCHYIVDHLMEPMYYTYRSEINEFRIFPQLFVNYCIDSLIEIGMLRCYGNIVFSVDQALLAILRGRIYTKGGV